MRCDSLKEEICEPVVSRRLKASRSKVLSADVR